MILVAFFRNYRYDDSGGRVSFARRTICPNSGRRRLRGLGRLVFLRKKEADLLSQPLLS